MQKMFASINQDKMNKKIFCNSIETLHKKWVGNTLGLETAVQGVDLWTEAFSGEGGQLAFELKCRKRNRMNCQFACREGQIKEYKRVFGTKNVFWIFLMYSMSCEVEECEHVKENLITSRQLYIVPWNWINRYEPLESKYLSYRYPKEKHLRELRLKYSDFNGTPIYYWNDERLKAIINHANNSGDEF